MEDLPLKPVPPQGSTPPAASSAEPDLETAEARQEEARTIRYAIGKLNDFLHWFVVVLEITLAIRFFLKLLTADPHNLFAGFLYALTDILLFPFAGIIRWPTPPFEWSTLIAMLVYWLIFWAIRRFLLILVSSPEEPIS